MASFLYVSRAVIKGTNSSGRKIQTSFQPGDITTFEFSASAPYNPVGGMSKNARDTGFVKQNVKFTFSFSAMVFPDTELPTFFNDWNETEATTVQIYTVNPVQAEGLDVLKFIEFTTVMPGAQGMSFPDKDTEGLASFSFTALDGKADQKA